MPVLLLIDFNIKLVFINIRNDLGFLFCGNPLLYTCIVAIKVEEGGKEDK